MNRFLNRFIFISMVFAACAWAEACPSYLSTSSIAAINVLLAQPCVGPFDIFLQPGAYALGSTAYSGWIAIKQSGVRLHGSGQGITTITYNSAGWTGSFGSGSAIAIGYGNSQVTMSDMTLQDLNSASSGYHGHNPSAIDAFNVNGLDIERVEIIDAKGNAAITNSGGVLNYGFIARDNYIHGTASGGLIEGDGINWGNIQVSTVENNHITGVLRNGLEGGGQMDDQRISDNVIDMENAGAYGMATLAINRGQVTGNIVKNVSGNGAGIGISTDGSQFSVSSLLVDHNYIQAVIGLRLETGTSPISNIRVLSNTIVAPIPIEIYNATDLEISDNYLLSTGGPAVNCCTGSNPAISTGSVVLFRGNRLPKSSVIFQSWPGDNWISPYVQQFDNVLETQ